MDTPLGKRTPVPERYDPALLAPLDRAVSRRELGIDDPLPFTGEDVWNGYELSWLSSSGMPRVAGLRLRAGADSPRLVESKSMKLYLNGLAQERFDSTDAVAAVLERDLGAAFGQPVVVSLHDPDRMQPPARTLPGASLDDRELTIDVYEREPRLLKPSGAGGVVEETLHTHLFRSLCPVTGQPDWASVLIRYRGAAIDRDSLLRYLVSFRRHQAFHETTVEQMFVDLKRQCACERLLVAGYFLRRGGLDINPFRGDAGESWPELRTLRQ